MDYEEFKAAVAPVGGRVVGWAAVVLPEGQRDNIVDGVAVAIMLPGPNPRWWITQYGSAPRGDMDKLRDAIARKIGTTPVRRRGLLGLAQAIISLFTN